MNSDHLHNEGTDKLLRDLGIKPDGPTLREQYLSGTVTHDEYYGAVAKMLGEVDLMMLLPGDAQAMARAYREGEHLNSIPLEAWDAKHPAVKKLAWAAIRRLGDEYVAVTGQRSWSLSDSVCVLKGIGKRLAVGEIARGKAAMPLAILGPGGDFCREVLP